MLENNWSWLGSPEACGFEVQCSTSEDHQNWTEFIPPLRAKECKARGE
ncbi:hypothetical protein PsalN5692_02325 [Piscirickettsia salmonis]|nr:hypothetical protein [Piscirickettsia salmonis]QGP50852.1 hypothetical protein PsalN5692_02325 [Piscirickettsia salmonis]